VAGQPLQLFNTLGRELHEFVPLEANRVRVYTCGPTVYSYQHIGNLRAYVFADTLRRALVWKGFDVEHVINITDVGHLTTDLDEGEDKLELASRREHRSVSELAAHYADVFKEDLERLRILRPHVWPKATDHVAEMIEFARVLERKGFGYLIDAGLFFDTSKVPDYGKLALLDLEGLLEGARVAPTPGKRNPTDFALWRASPKDAVRLMEWDSPWGPGAPGWHLECSAMSMKYLGDHFDIHTGGVDHIPVHHTNEIAQSEAYLGDGRPWVTYWLHNEFINLRHAKMSKSKGGTLLLSDLEGQGYHPLTYRLFLLGSHYRNQTEFTWRGLEGARLALRRLLVRLRERSAPAGEPVGYAEAASRLHGSTRAYLEELDAAISADLGTAPTLAALGRLSRDPEVPDEELPVVIGAYESVLAIGLLDLAPDDLDPPATRLVLSGDEVDRLLADRDDARRQGDFTGADEIRSMLERLGVEVRDTPEGTVWKVRPTLEQPLDR
jgi:cysteinyl-tRNA synthetase